MIIRITLKDPDGFGNAMKEAVDSSLAAIAGISDDERDELRDNRMEELSETLARWVEYDEYVRLEFDTEAGTARVLERRR